jgi:hypothetical protein
MCQRLAKTLCTGMALYVTEKFGQLFAVSVDKSTIQQK